MEPHYIWEISFVQNAVSIYCLVMRLLSGGRRLLTEVTCGQRVNHRFTEGWRRFQNGGKDTELCFISQILSKAY